MAVIVGADPTNGWILDFSADAEQAVNASTAIASVPKILRMPEAYLTAPTINSQGVTLGTDETIFHESMHADNRSDLDQIRWELVQERARGKVKDALIAELTEMLDAATTP